MYRTRTTSLAPSLLVALLVSAVAAGCDTGGIYPLLDRTDKIVPCDGASSTWLASTATGTHVYLIGSLTPATPLAPATRGCFAHAFIARDSSTTYETGTYAIDAAGNGDFRYANSYTFVYQPQRPILSRDGSTEHLYQPPESQALSITAGGPGLIVTRDGVTSKLTNLYDVVASLDTSTQQGGEDLFVVLNLPLFASQARLIGFGSGRMTRYVGGGAFFQGAIASTAPNEFSVSVASIASPTTYIHYYTFEDLSGIVVDGVQETDVNLSGNGSMQGILDWSMRDGPDVSDVAFEGTLDYRNLDIGDGHASGGTFELSVTSPASQTFTIAYTRANDVDLTHTLPIVP